MIVFLKSAFILSTVGLVLTGRPAEAQPNPAAGNCQAQLDAVSSAWSAIGLPMVEGGIQAKAGMIRLKNGSATSAANVQYMTAEFHEAADACHAGDDGAAKEKVAVIRDRLASLSR